MYNRVFNFSAGPSVLPVEVIEKVQSELLNYQGSGQSIMEMSHRSKELSHTETTLFFYFFVSGPLDILSLERMARGRSAMRMQVC